MCADMSCMTPAPSMVTHASFRLAMSLSRRVKAVLVLLLLLIGWGDRGTAQARVDRAEDTENFQRSPAQGTSGVMAATRPQRFLRGRSTVEGASGAVAFGAARMEHAALVLQQLALPQISPLTATWMAVGPMQVASPVYGYVTGRVTSIAVDPNDRSGNTVYVGTTGGGVWKSTNAAGDPAQVTFAPLTDTLPVFSANAGSAATPTLSIGAISVQGGVGGGVILAGTGDPNDALDSYYGSGILRSADGGVTWTLIRLSSDGAAGQHSFLGLSIAGFAWSTATPTMVVAAVSQALEGELVNASNASLSEKGLYYSTDAGQIWKMATIVDGSQSVQVPLPGNHGGGVAATAVVWNPVRERFYAAIRYHGYYESADGVTWTRLQHQPGTGLTMTACPTTSGVSGSTACPIYRGSLAVQPVTGDLFALTIDGSNVDQGLWQDVCGISGASCNSAAVTFGVRLNSLPLEVGGGNTVIAQGDYNLSLSAVAASTSASASDTLLYVGTTDLYRCSLAAECVLRNTTNASNGCAAPAKVAPAQHALATLTGGPSGLLYLGNDGGLWRSTDGVSEAGQACSPDDASHFQNLNVGLGSLAQPTSFAQDPADPGTLLVGLGAAGTAGTAQAGVTASAWPQLSAAEGGTVAIDPSNPLLWYLSAGAGVSLHPCTSGAACTAKSFSGPATIGPAQVALDTSAIDAPWILDPALPSEVLIGTCRTWRGPATDGSGWSVSNAISPLLGGPQNSSCTSSNPVIRSLAAAGAVSGAGSAQNAGSSVLYAGMAGTIDGGGRAYGGHIFATKNGGTANRTAAWTDLALGIVTNDAADQGRFNPGGFDISSLAADSHDATGATIYATVMGFTGNGINAPHVYRSLDGGGHWSNISANLPNAPANSVVVDPNDANTVYLGMDTGIYVTTQVASCTSSNCWSVYGVGLPNAPVVKLAEAAGMATGDGRVGELRAATYGRGIWQIPLLTAAFPAQPTMLLTPVALRYVTQPVGTVSGLQTITVTNTGSAALLVSQVATTGDFHATTSCTGRSVAPGTSCLVQVSFLPTAIGLRSGVLTVYGNVQGGQATVSLGGDGAPPAVIALNPVTETFGATLIGATSAIQNITISNTGGVPLGLQAVQISGDFHLTANTCGTTLPSSTGCTVSVTFLPTATGTRMGTLTVVDDLGTQTAVLTGQGSAPATDALSPMVLTFAPQQLTTASGMQTIVLSNVGDVPLTLISTQIVQGDFSVVNACGNSLSGHASCSIGIVFQPKSVGAATGVLRVSDQYRSQMVSLNGFGVAPPGVSLSPVNSLGFAALGVGIISSPQTVTVTNNGGLPLSLREIRATGDFVVSSLGNCGTNLAVGSACALQVVFTPSATGPRAGILSVADDAPNSPQGIALNGTGVDFSLAADGSTTVTVANGKGAVFPLLLSSPANVPGSAAFSCTGLPANTTCSVSPGLTIALGQTTTVSVTVATGVTLSAASSRRNKGEEQDGRSGPWWLAILLPVGLLGWRHRSSVTIPRLMAMAGLLCLLLPMGCGATRRIPVDGAAGTTTAVAVTPPGTYPITVSASSAGLVRTIRLTLVVQ